jgi:hypothetical protein
MSISNYGELKTAISDWLDRTDAELVDKIPDFIALSESDIMRTLAARNNELSTEVDRTTEDPLTDRISLPTDYREMVTLTSNANGNVDPMTRVSLSQIQEWQRNPSQGPPEAFARDQEELVMYPFPDAGYIYNLHYYSKLVPLGSVAGDSDTNSLLQNEPGVYLFGALSEAQPFVKGDDLQLVALWKTRYDAILQGIGVERSEEDRSGSNVVVRGAFGPSGGSRINSRGWA